MDNNILELKQENHRLKTTISQYKQVARLTNWLDDSTLKGGYRIVKSIRERDAIDSCHRKIGMIVSVQESETEYTNYRLIKNNTWVEVTTDGEVPGLSAYELAIINGEFEGTLEEWLESLKSNIPGPPGPVGNISVINFEIDDNMHLIMELETNSNLNFELTDDGRLILI